MAQSFTGVLVAISACVTAPVPRPPQPIKPTFSTSEPAAYKRLLKADPTATDVAATAECFMKSRRENPLPVFV